MGANGETNGNVGTVRLGVVLDTKSIASQLSRAMRDSSAVNSAKKLGNSIGNSIGDSMKSSMRKSMSGLSSEIKSSLSSMRRYVSGINDSIKSSFSTVGKLAAAYLGTRAIVNFGKSALDLGSDLTEVQNVVDTVFGNMSGQVNEFAQNAMTSYGLSETMAKKFTGNFGAMAKSFGFTTQQAAKMGETLTGLAGDVASFYNISQDEAYTKLKSVFSGETETLKDLGIVMTQNALDQYALANGYGKTTSAMSEQEKTALRYQFVLDKLSLAQGDFARTSDSWANQMRVLTLQFQSFKAAIGQGLINVLTPVLKMLNTLMSKLVSLANAFKNFTAFLTGKSASVSSTGAAISDVASSMNDVADNTSSAGKEIAKTAKTVSRSTMAFDKLNKLSSNKDSDSDSGSSSAPSFGSLGGGADLSSLVDTEKTANNIVSDFARKLKDAIDKGDWYQVGYLIGDKIADSLEKINWNKIYAKERDIVNKISGVLNGLFDNKRMWSDIGSTIGNGIGVAVSFLDDLVQNTNWASLGDSVMTALMSAFRNIPWEKLGHILTDGLKIALEFLHGFVSGDYVSKFKEIGDDIGIMLASAISNIDVVQGLGDLGKLINGIFFALSNALNHIPFAQLGHDFAVGLNDMFANIDFGNVGSTIGRIVQGLLTMFHEFIIEFDFTALGTDIGTMIASAIQSIDIVQFLGDLGTLASGIFDSILAAVRKIPFGQLGADIANGLNAMFDNINWETIGTTIYTVINKLIELLHNFLANADWASWGNDFGTMIATAVNGVDYETALGNVGSLALGLLKLITNAATTALSNINFAGLGHKLAESLNNIVQNVDLAAVLQSIVNVIVDLLTGIADFATEFMSTFDFTTFATTVINAIKSVDWSTLIQSLLDAIWALMPALLPVFCAKIVGHMVTNLMTGLTGDLLTSVSSFFTETLGPKILSYFADTLGPNLGSIVSDIGTKLVDVFSVAGGKLTGSVLPAIADGFSTVFGFIAANPIVLIIGAIVGLVALIATKGDEIQEVLHNVQSFVDGVFSKDLTEIFGPVLGEVFNKFRDVIKGVFDGVMDIFNGVIDFIRGVFTGNWARAWQGVTEIFGGIMGGLGSIVKAPLNAVISLVNKAISALNRLRVNVPSAIASLTGFSSFGFNIPKIPMLAQGGYVNANTPQLAMIGDNKHEGEIVAPESKITEAVNNAVSPLADALNVLAAALANSNNSGNVNDGTPINIYLDGQRLESIILGAQDRNRLKTSGSV